MVYEVLAEASHYDNLLDHALQLEIDLHKQHLEHVLPLTAPSSYAVYQEEHCPD